MFVTVFFSISPSTNDDDCIVVEMSRYRMAENFGGKILWWIAEIMTFGGIHFSS